MTSDQESISFGDIKKVTSDQESISFGDLLKGNSEIDQSCYLRLRAGVVSLSM